MSDAARKQVGLFVTCLVDLYRPVVGFAAIALIERSGPFTVVVPEAQTCCGQPGYNSGDRESALAIARQVVQAFEGFDYVVAPSGSCAGMIKTHYPELLAGDPAFAARAAALAGTVMLGIYVSYLFISLPLLLPGLAMIGGGASMMASASKKRTKYRQAWGIPQTAKLKMLPTVAGSRNGGQVGLILRF